MDQHCLVIEDKNNPSKSWKIISEDPIPLIVSGYHQFITLPNESCIALNKKRYEVSYLYGQVLALDRKQLEQRVANLEERMSPSKSTCHAPSRRPMSEAETEKFNKEIQEVRAKEKAEVSFEVDTETLANLKFDLQPGEGHYSGSTLSSPEKDAGQTPADVPENSLAEQGWNNALDPMVEGPYFVLPAPVTTESFSVMAFWKHGAWWKDVDCTIAAPRSIMWWRPIIVPEVPEVLKHTS